MATIFTESLAAPNIIFSNERGVNHVVMDVINPQNELRQTWNQTSNPKVAS